jgi:hypothetical protein
MDHAARLMMMMMKNYASCACSECGQGASWEAAISENGLNLTLYPVQYCQDVFTWWPGGIVWAHLSQLSKEQEAGVAFPQGAKIDFEGGLQCGRTL